MARRFGRDFENPERRIENVKENINDITASIDPSYEDNFDKKIDKAEKMQNDTSEKYDFLSRIKKQINSAEKTTNTQRKAFLQEIKEEQSQEDTPLMIAYRELDRARKNGDREDIIKAEDRILDLERQEQKREYTTQIAELKKMQQKARKSGDSELLAQFKKKRQKFVSEMKYDELDYELKKLQNSQRLEPSNEKLKQIVTLKQELDALELEALNK